MLKTLRCYVWVFVFILILYPYTSITGSDTPKAGKIWKEPVTGMEFVWVPGGCYEMGCGNWTSDCYREEKPVHEVCVDGFWMGKTEVTQGQWKRVMGKNPASFKKGDNYPVENVSWLAVRDFSQKLSSLNNAAYEFRFPTEAEWEYACRSGGKSEKYAGGNEFDQVAWHQGNSKRTTHPVATKTPNSLGLYDMSGNVLEWCKDKHDTKAYAKHQRDNPIIATASYYLGITGEPHVKRGGGWMEEPKKSRCSCRDASGMLHTQSNIGFRLVRSK
jgi:formylglycine-generating enzyme required for sulfatase activity